MRESQKTLIFAGVAVVCAVVAVFARPTLPTEPKDFGDLGAEFYPEFQDPTAATSLTLVTYNSDRAEIKPFEVQRGADGLWRITSVHNYPADGTDQLAKTAASMIGITRDGLAGRFENEHEEFGVIAPASDDATALKGRGQRITLKDADGAVLCDYVIGNAVEGRDGYYYIRRPDEKLTFIAKLGIELSTKFSDWIESDLLQVERDDIRKIIVDKYSIDEAQGRIVDKELSVLTRTSGTEPWALEGIEETNELKTEEVRKIVNGLDELNIVGVRKKPEGLDANLQLAKERQQIDARTMLALQNLQRKGFFLADLSGGKTQLVSDEGEVVAATEDGVVYHLHFGDVFTGSEFEIEVGFADENAEAAPADDAEADDAKADDETSAEDGESSDERNRYLFVQVEFDPAMLGDAPQPPTKPEPPAEQPAADDTADADAAKPDGDEAATENTDAEAKEEKSDAQKEYEAALKIYEADLKDYEQKKTAFDEKMKSGQERVAELQQRFADWYYVISAKDFANLRLARSELVKPKETPEEETMTDGPSLEAPAAPTPPAAESNSPADARSPANQEKPNDSADGATP